MSYVVLARKWRPVGFDDLLGQEHVTRTLSNAIRAQRIAHAFLFSGPRGVGKTSAARILARALNCTSFDGPTDTPCGVCPRCVEITEGRSTDVFEIDAASHTGVDNIREIIENVRYLPSAARFKVYVIDEVHMLSTGAFNALLKTLEEPPEHVKFVLATTDVHKVPSTILSRVQRYDFRRIPGRTIAERLSSILDAEGVAHEPSALTVVAREADGSMRDAQSLLEQVLAFIEGGTLDAARARAALGVVDLAYIEAAANALIERRPGDVFDVVSKVHDRGLDLIRFAEAVVEHLRDLLAARWVEAPQGALERPEDEVQALVERAQSTDPVDLERLFRHASKLVEDLALTSHPRFLLEVGLAGLAEAPPRVDLEALVDRLDAMERGAPAPRSAAPKRAASSSTPLPGPGAGAASRPKASPRAQASPAPPNRPAAAAAKEEPPSASSSGADDAGQGFRAFVNRVRTQRPALAASLAQVQVAAFSREGVRLGCSTAFDLENLRKPPTMKLMESVLEDFFGARVPLEITRGSGSTQAAPSLDEQDEAAKTARIEAKKRAAAERPAVRAVTGELGGAIESVRVLDED